MDRLWEEAAISAEEYLRQVGSLFPPSSWILITQEMIDAFAEVTGDHQFIHTDPDRAAETPFGGTIAHGFLTLSLIPRILIEVVPEPEGCTSTLNYGSNRLRFLSPVPSGARVRGKVMLARVEENGADAVTLTFEISVEIENQEKPALVTEWLTRQYFQTG